MNKQKPSDDGKSSRYHVPLPEIPGVVYKGFTNGQQAMFSLALSAAAIFFLDMTSVEIIIPLIGLLVAFLLWKIYPEQPRQVHISATTVKANFGRGRVVAEPLANYFLHIETRSGRAFSGYTYTVGLRPKEEHARLGIKEITSKTVAVGSIPLRKRILLPDNLREWVAAFQRQVEKPLEMVFDSEKTREEYQQGKFLKR